jgi:hypothetical protein
MTSLIKGRLLTWGSESVHVSSQVKSILNKRQPYLTCTFVFHSSQRSPLLCEP